MPSSIRLGKIAGIQIDLDYSWLLVLILGAWTLAQHYLGAQSDAPLAARWTMVVAICVFGFGSVLLHELAHCFAANAFGRHVASLRLYLFGGLTDTVGAPDDTRGEYIIAAAGPLTNVLIALVFGLVWLISRTAFPVMSEIAFWTAGLNAALAATNLIPGLPLDAGRMLRAAISARSHRALLANQVALGVGLLGAWAIIFAGIWLQFSGAWADGLWLAFVGAILFSAVVEQDQSTLIAEKLRGHTVREVFDPRPTCVYRTICLDLLMENVIEPEHKRWLAVMDQGRLVGVVTRERIESVPRSHWKRIRVMDVLTPLERMMTVTPDDDLSRVLESMSARQMEFAVVREGERYLGLLSLQMIRDSWDARVQMHGRRSARLK